MKRLTGLIIAIGLLLGFFILLFSYAVCFTLEYNFFAWIDSAKTALLLGAICSVTWYLFCLLKLRMYFYGKLKIYLSRRKSK